MYNTIMFFLPKFFIKFLVGVILSFLVLHFLGIIIGIPFPWILHSVQPLVCFLMCKLMGGPENVMELSYCFYSYCKIFHAGTILTPSLVFQ